MNKTYIGMSSKHLINKVGKNLNPNNSRKSGIKHHWQQCKSCSKSEIDLHSSFMVLKKVLNITHIILMKLG